MNTPRLGPICVFEDRMSRRAELGLFFVSASAGLDLLSIRNIPFTISFLTCSRQRYMTSSILGAVEFIRICHKLWLPIYSKTGISFCKS